MCVRVYTRVVNRLQKIGRGGGTKKKKKNFIGDYISGRIMIEFPPPPRLFTPLGYFF